MIVDSSFSKYIVLADDSISAAFAKINNNKSRIVFVVAESGIFLGSFTDGDFRRWAANSTHIDLTIPVSELMNKDAIYASHDLPKKNIHTLLSSKITAVPILDDHFRIVAVASSLEPALNIGSKYISENSPCFIIAEIGNNHNGSIDLAFELIDHAHYAGADSAKFQMRDMKSLYSNSGESDDISSDLGTQYTLDLLERFQLTDEELLGALIIQKKKG